MPVGRFQLVRIRLEAGRRASGRRRATSYYVTMMKSQSKQAKGTARLGLNRAAAAVPARDDAAASAWPPQRRRIGGILTCTVTSTSSRQQPMYSSSGWNPPGVSFSLYEIRKGQMPLTHTIFLRL